MLANVLNPKAALFFVAVLPQFLTPGSSVAGPVIVLGLLDVALGLISWTVFVLASRRVTSLLGGTRPGWCWTASPESRSNRAGQRGAHGTSQGDMEPARGSSRIGPASTRVSGSR